MKNLKLIFFVIIGLIGIFIIYIIAKDTFVRNNTIFEDGISFYNEQKYAAAEQNLQSEADKGNKKAYPFLGHTKLVLGKSKEAEKYLLLSLEDNPDEPTKSIILLNLGSTVRLQTNLDILV